MNKTLREKQIEAEVKSANWLAKANEQREAGRDDSKAIAKATYWLAILNDLEGKL